MDIERINQIGSLLADLSREEENPRLRVHDRTHLEVSIDYDLVPKSEGGADKQTFFWEAYLFAPESLRIDSRTYGKQDVYEDLQSYVRLAVPDVPFAALAIHESDPGDISIYNADPISESDFKYDVSAISGYSDYGTVTITNTADGELYAGSVFGSAIGIYGYSLSGDVGDVGVTPQRHLGLARRPLVLGAAALICGSAGWNSTCSSAMCTR